MLAGGAIVVAATVVICDWHHRVRQRAETLSAELRQIEGRWSVAAAALDDARQARVNFDRFAAKAAEITSACQSFAWSSAMVGGLLDSETSSVELREVRAHRAAGASHAWTLQVAGRAGGGRPHAVADTFRLKAQSELERKFKASVTTRFAKMEELPGAEAALGGDRMVAFTVLATIELRERLEGTGG